MSDIAWFLAFLLMSAFSICFFVWTGYWNYFASSLVCVFCFGVEFAGIILNDRERVVEL